MSTKVMALCWGITGLTILQKAVLISLADQANDDGICWPSVATIAERVCSCERAVQESIRGLISIGLLRRDFRPGKPTFYKLTPAGNAPPQEMHPAGNAGKGVQDIPLRGAGNADITVIEPSVEPPIDITHPADVKPTPKKPKRRKPVGDLDYSGWPSQPSAQVLSDWLDHRKQKRASVSQTVIDRFAKELRLAAQAGYSVDDCLAECVTRGWQGFEFSWIQRARQNDLQQRPQPAADRRLAVSEATRNYDKAIDF